MMTKAQKHTEHYLDIPEQTRPRAHHLVKNNMEDFLHFVEKMMHIVQHLMNDKQSYPTFPT